MPRIICNWERTLFQGSKHRACFYTSYLNITPPSLYIDCLMLFGIFVLLWWLVFSFFFFLSHVLKEEESTFKISRNGEQFQFLLFSIYIPLQSDKDYVNTMLISYETCIFFYMKWYEQKRNSRICKVVIYIQEKYNIMPLSKTSKTSKRI